MVELTQTVMKAVFAPPLVPVERPIDLEHLARMTLGDRALEREVLGLFVRQAGMLRTRMETATAEVIGAAAHTLKGSASGIGAFAIARASADIESCVEMGDGRGLQTAMAALDIAVSQIVAEISENLRADSTAN
jgi:HPt (histidine-containing phosphotransfer) domain-containing protein